MTTGNESALIVTVPESESLVQGFRLRYDPSASRGVPGHITILYPFKPASLITRDDEEILSQCFEKLREFTLQLVSIEKFPNVLYLATDMPNHFQAIAEAVVKAFPVYPAYRGKFSKTIPHLTVAEFEDSQMEAVDRSFRVAAASMLPIRAVVKEVWLYINSDGRWKPKQPSTLKPIP